ncbi:thioesterase [Phytohabitans suffuscus]|uniref:Thioesterase n=2 Tax=Phytohabitans suffuscus TaxID=624315 RepID=A0A6F8YTH4_9ACTN|nr:thioesterase [Phytohabitans suffuscus]
MRPDERARWLKSFGRRGPADVRLFCFHHAGGTASAYRDWPRLMPAAVEPVAVQLPGRADRFREPALDQMPVLVDHLVEVLLPLLDEPYAFYGLSMGARVAWALTHSLRDEGLPPPAALFLASVAVPGHREGKADWTEGEVLEYLRQMGGTPPEIFSEPALLAGLLPTLRADLKLVDSFHLRPATPLRTPIHVFAGIDDVEGSPKRMNDWQAETLGRFDLDVVTGGHFFDRAGEHQVIRAVTEDLLRKLAAVSLGLSIVEPTGARERAGGSLR